jgi:IclR family transcriptional regulator, KDG regulon repressor
MSKESIQSVVKALKILELFTEKPGWSITEIGEKLAYPSSTAHRLIITLEEAGYLYREDETKKYFLTIKPYLIGSKTETVSQLEKQAQRVIQLLAQEINESVNVSIAQGIYAVTVLKANPERKFSAVPNIGDKRQLHATSVGKCLLAFNSNGCYDQLMNSKESLLAYNKRTVTDRVRIGEALNTVRENGFAIDREEVEDGLTCFGAPIFDEMRHCIAAISISVPTFRIEKEKVFIDKVIKTASEITSKF